MRAIAAFAALVPLLTLPALAERAAIDKCKSDADQAITTLNARMTSGASGTEALLLQEQRQQAMKLRSTCDVPDNQQKR
jgi:hypothetical protein